MQRKIRICQEIEVSSTFCSTDRQPALSTLKNESWEGNKSDRPDLSTLQTPALIGAVLNRFRQERSAWILIKRILVELLKKDLLIEGQTEL